MNDRTDTSGADLVPTLAPPPEAKAGVTLDAGAGKGEAELLMVGALRAAASTIIDATLVAVATAAPTEILLFASGEAVDLTPLERFEAACEQLTAQLHAALAPPMPPQTGERGIGDRSLTAAVAAVVPGLNIAAAALSLAATAAQYFAVRTSFAGIELKAQDAMLQRELASALLARRAGISVRLAPLYDRAASTAILTMLQAVGDLGAAASAAAEGQGVSAEQIAALRAAASAQADFRARLVTADPTGSQALDGLAGLRAVRDALDRNAALLCASTALASGGHFSRQGLFGGILRDPTSEVCAAVVVGYTVLTGPALKLVAAGNVRAPTRYVALRDVAAAVDDTIGRSVNAGRLQH